MDDDATELPLEIVNFDRSAGTGQLYTRYTGTISSTVNTVVRIYYNHPEKQLHPVHHPYGRNAVWANYEAVWHLEADPSGAVPQFVDSTGNGYGLHSRGSMTVDDLIPGQLGNEIDFDGSDDYLLISGQNIAIDGNMSVTAWSVNTSSSKETILGNDTNLGDFYQIDQFNSRTLANIGNTQYTFTHTYSQDVDYKFTLTSDGSDNWNSFVDTTPSTDNPVAATGALTTNNLGRPRDIDLAALHAGTIDEVRIANFTMSSDWITAEYNNQSSPSTFYAVGSEQQVDFGLEYVEFTIQASQIPSDLTDYVAYFDLADIPGGANFWKYADPNGDDLRLAKADGTELAFELVNFDVPTRSGELHVKYSGTLSSSVNSEVRLYFHSNNKPYAPADTYGRNSVWSSYDGVWHMSDDPSVGSPQLVDATASGINLTSFGSMTAGDLVDGQLGKEINFDGSDDSFRVSGVHNESLSAFTIQALIKPEQVDVTYGILGCWGSNLGYNMFIHGGSNTPRLAVDNTYPTGSDPLVAGQYS